MPIAYISLVRLKTLSNIVNRHVQQFHNVIKSFWNLRATVKL